MQMIANSLCDKRSITRRTLRTTLSKDTSKVPWSGTLRFRPEIPPPSLILH